MATATRQQHLVGPRREQAYGDVDGGDRGRPRRPRRRRSGRAAAPSTAAGRPGRRRRARPRGRARAARSRRAAAAVGDRPARRRPRGRRGRRGEHARHGLADGLAAAVAAGLAEAAGCGHPSGVGVDAQAMTWTCRRVTMRRASSRLAAGMVPATWSCENDGRAEAWTPDGSRTVRQGPADDALRHPLVDRRPRRRGRRRSTGSGSSGSRPRPPGR